MKANEHGSFGVFVGIDWADAKHDVCLQAAGTAVRLYEQFSHRPADIDEWVASVRRRFPGTIAIELSKGPIVSALQRHDDLVIYPINPSTLAKYREAFTPSRGRPDRCRAGIGSCVNAPRTVQAVEPSRR